MEEVSKQEQSSEPEISSLNAESPQENTSTVEARSDENSDEAERRRASLPTSALPHYFDQLNNSPFENERVSSDSETSREEDNQPPLQASAVSSLDTSLESSLSWSSPREKENSNLDEDKLPSQTETGAEEPQKNSSSDVQPQSSSSSPSSSSPSSPSLRAESSSSVSPSSTPSLTSSSSTLPTATLLQPNSAVPKPASAIVSPTSSSNINLGSLLRLFKSGFFDAWLNLTYLFKHPNPGVHDYLCNELYNLPDDDVEFFLPQLCNLLIYKKYETNSLERFLLDRCAKSIHFALKVCWHVQASLEDGSPGSLYGFAPPGIREKCMRLLADCETAVVNCERPRSGFKDSGQWEKKIKLKLALMGQNPEQEFNESAKSEENLVESPETPSHVKNQIINEALAKNDRCSYYQTLQRFVADLGQISEKLTKVFPVTGRLESLQKEIQQLNETLPVGMYLPIFTSSHLHHCIVRIPPEEAIVLNSRDRVPYMICVEAIGLPSVSCASSGLDITDLMSLFASIRDSVKKNLKSSGEIPVNTTIAQMVSAPIPVAPRNNNILANLPPTSNTGNNPAFNPNQTLDAPGAGSAGSAGAGGIGAGEQKETAKKTEGDANSRPRSKSPVPSGANMEPTLANIMEKVQRKSSVSQLTAADEKEIAKAKEGDEKERQAEEQDLLDLQKDFSVVRENTRTALSYRADDVVGDKKIGERWADKVERLRRGSPYGRLPGWSLYSVIIKHGDECRQESMAMQLIRQFQRIFRDSNLPLYLRSYQILVTSSKAGLIETIPDVMSLHQVKKIIPGFTTLTDYYKKKYPGAEAFRLAQRNFVESMAAYSIVSYLLALKDRHNGNILLDAEGHLIHVDFGFFLSNSPGNWNWETAPFKLTPEFVDLMDGLHSSVFQYFKALVIRGFLETRKYSDRIVMLVEIAMATGPPLPCLMGGERALADLKSRFHMDLTEDEFISHVDSLIFRSYDNWRTKRYDQYQYLTNYILP